MEKFIEAEIIPQKTKVHVGGFKARLIGYGAIAILAFTGYAYASSTGLLDTPREAAQRLVDDAKEAYVDAQATRGVLTNTLKQQMLIEAKVKAQLALESAKTDEITAKISSLEQLMSSAAIKADAGRYMLSVIEAQEKSFEVKK